MTKEFIASRRFGKVAEQLFACKLRDKGFSVDVVKSGYRPDYDLIVEGKGIRFTAEIKRDRKARETGNVCVELSALRHSKASILFYMIDDENWYPRLYISDLQKMLRYAESYPVQKNVGEFGLAAALIPKSIFVSLPFVQPF